MFFNRRGFRKGNQHRNRFCTRRSCPVEYDGKEVFALSECLPDKEYIIVCNPIKKTKEIGINPGKEIVVFKNEPSDYNMIVSLETTRYIIAKSLADQILVTLKEMG